MSVPQLDALAEAVHTAIGSYEPEDPVQLLAYLRGFPEVLDAFVQATRHLGERLAEDYEVDPGVAEGVTEAGTAMSAAASWFENAAALMAAVHAPDLERHESPRRRERDYWNVT